MVKIVHLNQSDRSRYQEGILALEGGVEYPLGDDFFHLSHGEDYFRFFDRLGTVRYVVAITEEEDTPGPQVVGAQCFILRRVPLFQSHSRTTPTWYSCDTKVHTDFRSSGTGAKLLGSSLGRTMLWNQLKFGAVLKGYGISMNSTATSNRMRGHSRGFQRRLPGFNVDSKLLALYSLDYEQMLEMAPLLTRYRGALSYLSLPGVKDIILKSTGSRLPLTHVQWGALADPAAVPSPMPGHVHMFCAVQGTPLWQAVENESGVSPSATATIYHIRMKSDFAFILTSDI